MPLAHSIANIIQIWKLIQEMLLAITYFSSKFTERKDTPELFPEIKQQHWRWNPDNPPGPESLFEADTSAVTRTSSKIFGEKPSVVSRNLKPQGARIVRDICHEPPGHPPQSHCSHFCLSECPRLSKRNGLSNCGIEPVGPAQLADSRHTTTAGATLALHLSLYAVGLRFPQLQGMNLARNHRQHLQRQVEFFPSVCFKQH